MRKASLTSLASGLLALGMLLQPHSAMPVSGQWGVVFAIDAPWRLEPVEYSKNRTNYGAIPIMISFRQAINELGREHDGIARRVLGSGSEITVGRVTEVKVTEIVRERLLPSSTQLAPQPTTRITPAQFREVERKRMIATKEKEPDHELCRPFLGEPCDGMLSISDTDEWHAIFWYSPAEPVFPGRNVHLIVSVLTVSGGNGRHVWEGSLVIHAGESPLPRFGPNWLYGDLHYHSQMTTNEGEFGYSYRNVARMLGKLGLDFVFTTDHASNGSIVMGEVTVGRCGSPMGRTCPNYLPSRFRTTNCEDGSKVKTCIPYTANAARDLNASRFVTAKTIIYGSDGATAAGARDAEFGLGRVRRDSIFPQVYMGEEVDAWPEMSSEEQTSGAIVYGENLKYSWANIDNCIEKEGLARCRDKYSERYSADDPGRYGVKDEQHYPFVGSNVSKSRQHLVYFPMNSSPSPQGWVASDTGKFGGATKRLEAVLKEIQGGGFAFLAHPLEGKAPGKGMGGGAGPDVVPYSDSALEYAWSSPAILGLEFWNEDNHYRSNSTVPAMIDKRGEGDNSESRFTLQQPYQYPDSSTGASFYTGFPWRWESDADLAYEFEKLYHGAFTWDRYLRKGLKPSETARLRWLSMGEPRKWFMAGGSDAHGDLNYRQLGEMCDSRWCTSGIIDTTIGKPRNLVLVRGTAAGSPIPELPNTKRYTNRQVIDALRAGQFSVTDGPAIRIAIDKNRNGIIDDADYQMGSTFNLYKSEKIPVLVEWLSTPEFGPIQEVDVYVGTPSATFAPKNHGPLASGIAHLNGQMVSNREYDANNPEGYHSDPSNVLKVLFQEGTRSPGMPLPPVDSMRYHGLAQLHLNPVQFGITNTDQLLFYIRAFARTVDAYARSRNPEDPTAINDMSLQRCPSLPRDAGNNCGFRIAYSNPVWGRHRSSCRGGPYGSALDSDFNKIPDTCERVIPDPCLMSPPGGHRTGGAFKPPDRPVVDKDPDLAHPEAPVAGGSCQMVRTLVYSIAGGDLSPPSPAGGAEMERR